METPALKNWQAARRKVEQEIREVKDRQLREFMKTSKLDGFSPEALRAAEADIEAALVGAHGKCSKARLARRDFGKLPSLVTKAARW